MTSFEELGLSEQLLTLIHKAGFTEPSEIQAKAIPLALEGKDIIGGSATGSGKTLAFGLGIIEKVTPGEGIQSLIMTPTRELAEQIGMVFKKFSAYKNIKVATVYGGISITPQVRELQKADVVVGTPGRLLDHIQRGTINLSSVKILVLDEADRMLDMGFIEDVEKIIWKCPEERQTLLFSATISRDIEHIAKKHMNNPESIDVDSYVNPELLKQIFYDVPKNEKFSLLVHLLKRESSGLIMVFCNTRHNTDFVADNLSSLGIDAMAIHGGLSQDKRSRIMQRFHDKKAYVLVCTDVAARGLDIKGVSHVYNYDIPKTSKDYIHRIGRTARAGKEGIAVNIVSDRDYENFRVVRRDESLNIEKEKLPEDIEKVWINTGRKPLGRTRIPGRFGSGRGTYGGGRSEGSGRTGRDGNPSEYRSGSGKPRRNIKQRTGHYRNHNSGKGSRHNPGRQFGAGRSRF